MADKKISQLSAASLPLAGTEPLPIVQSSATVKVAVNDLTVKNIRSNATTGILQVAGPTTAATRVMTTPDANFTVARTDAANSFTGDQTLSTGNLVVGTAGKGIDFSATANGVGTMTSELLADYEEGTWTPTCAGVTLTVTSATYTKIGRAVSLSFDVTWPTTSDTTVVTLSNFPFSSVANTGSIAIGYTNATFAPNGAASGFGVVFWGKGGDPGASVTNADLSGKRVIGSVVYAAS